MDKRIRQQIIYGRQMQMMIGARNAVAAVRAYLLEEYSIILTRDGVDEDLYKTLVDVFLDAHHSITNLEEALIEEGANVNT